MISPNDTFPFTFSIEGNPFITRFKTSANTAQKFSSQVGIEGNPFITRFKTIVANVCLVS